MGFSLWLLAGLSIVGVESRNVDVGVNRAGHHPGVGDDGVGNHPALPAPRGSQQPQYPHSTLSAEEHATGLVPIHFELPVPLQFQLHNVRLNVRADIDSDLVFYVHIPKTAGQTFHRILARSFKGCAVADKDCNKHGGLSQAIAPRIDQTYATKRSDKDKFDFPEKLNKFFEGKLAALGHVDASIGMAIYPRRTIFITMMRDPTKRIFSWFNYMRSNTDTVLECLQEKASGNLNKSRGPNARFGDSRGPGHPGGIPKLLTDDLRLDKLCNEMMTRRRIMHNQNPAQYIERQIKEFGDGLDRHSEEDPYILGPNCLPANMSASKFIESLKHVGLDNYMTRAYSGTTMRSYFKTRQSFSDEELLDIAKKTLATFPFVGITERFSDSVRLYLWTFGFPEDTLEGEDFEYNKSKNHHEHDEADVRAVADMEYLDRQLYEYGLALFEERFQKMEADIKAHGGWNVQLSKGGSHDQKKVWNPPRKHAGPVDQYF